MALSAEILGDRWTLLVLREAFYGVVRYEDMLADLGAPRSTLTDRLAKLVEIGVLTRRAYREPGARTRFAYALTEKGRGLGLSLMALSQWGEAHVTGAPAPVAFTHVDTGARLRVALIDEAGGAHDLDKARLRLRDRDPADG